MRCLGCGAEMQLTNVAQADAMMIPGFEHHTMTCPVCGDVERRLVFGRREQRAEPPGEIPIEPLIEPPIEPLIEPPIESLLALPAESTPLSPADSAHQAEPLAEPLEVRKPWTQAIERLHLRHTAMARETTGKADAGAEPAQPAKLADELDDFDRLWDSLAAPASPPPPSIPLAAALDRREPPAVSRLDASAQSGDRDAPAQALAEAAQPQTIEATPRQTSEPEGEVLPQRKLPAPFPAASPNSSGLPAAFSARSGSRGSKGPGVLRNAWARAAAMLRPRQGGASKPNSGDAILQVNAGDLGL
jgi:hypothetical protein